MNRSDLPKAFEIADLIPTPQFSEFHARVIPAAPEVVWAALHDLGQADLPIARLLMGARSIASAKPRQHGETFWEALPIPLVREVPASYALAAGIGRPWSPSGASLTRGIDDLATFHDPGWAKVAMDFRLVRTSDGTLLATETRVVTTDPVSRAKFRAYWTVIRPFSGVIRKEILRSVDRATRRRG